MLRFGLLALLLVGFVPGLHADATVLLEEPYSYDGALAGTGHTAVYLSRVCAATPVILRRCEPGERGVVVSRYTRIGGYDWIAIPLIPYLYAVENPDDVPLYADSKLAAFLRDRYRRSHLEEIAPDGPSGDTPKGDWVQLIGSSYDRTSYGFQIETSPEQDDALIAWLNTRSNDKSYNFVSRNCADFVRDVLNFYYPKAVSRGFITDLEITTPKHAAKSLVRYSNHHPDLLFSRVVFPQVPGTMKRSKPVRGVLESLVRAKKYVLPFAAFHPIVAGGVVTIYLVGDRFNPAHEAKLFNLGGDPAAPVTDQERKLYLKNLKALMASDSVKGDQGDDASWRQFQDKAELRLDGSGQPVLAGTLDGRAVEIGVAWDDITSKGVPAELQRGLIEARLRQQLARGRAPKISRDELHEDWQLLEEINAAEKPDGSAPAERKNQKLANNAD